MVVGALSKGPIRYNEIGRRVQGFRKRMLTLTLKGLEQDGLVTRTMFPTIPPRVTTSCQARAQVDRAVESALQVGAGKTDRRCWPHRGVSEKRTTRLATRALPSRNRPSAHASQNWMNSVIEYQKAVECVQHDSVKATPGYPMTTLKTVQKTARNAPSWVSPFFGLACRSQRFIAS